MLSNFVSVVHNLAIKHVVICKKIVKIQALINKNKVTYQSC